MKWDALKSMQCPKNGALLEERPTGYACTSPEEICGFFISKAKFDTVVQSLYAPKPKRCGTFDEDGNLSALNNLGRSRAP